MGGYIKSLTNFVNLLTPYLYVYVRWRRVILCRKIATLSFESVALAIVYRTYIEYEENINRTTHIVRDIDTRWNYVYTWIALLYKKHIPRTHWWWWWDGVRAVICDSCDKNVYFYIYWILHYLLQHSILYK